MAILKKDFLGYGVEPAGDAAVPLARMGDPTIACPVAAYWPVFGLGRFGRRLAAEVR